MSLFITQRPLRIGDVVDVSVCGAAYRAVVTSATKRGLYLCNRSSGTHYRPTTSAKFALVQRTNVRTFGAAFELSRQYA